MVLSKTENRIIIGVSHSDLERLKAGEAMQFNLDALEYDKDDTLMIVSEETDEKIVQELTKIYGRGNSVFMDLRIDKKK